MKVRLIKDIWDDGADHHPSGYIARKGEVLNVLESFNLGYEVAHDGRTMGFYVGHSECEPIVSPPTVSAE